MWQRGWVIAIAISASACTKSSTVVCDNGSVCPANYACAADGCISPADAVACMGMPDDTPCNVIGAGVCRDGRCVVALCGNEKVELDEVCDDGNVENGDGCSGTCRSDETCGNGVSELLEECDCGDAANPGGVTCKVNDANTFNGGVVCSEACKRRFCGNGIVELDEVCDDGNAVSGDRCRFDCGSLETCPNGIVDSAAGEECDDSNTRNLDGCSSTCKTEPRDWQLLTFADKPSARNGAAMVYDVARQRTVLFGSGDGDVATWEFDGTSWRKVTQVGPPPGLNYRMVYDAARARVVMFGEVVGLVSVMQTWEFDGVQWTKLATATTPPPRRAFVLAYDARRKRTVLFGGFDGQAMQAIGDTWEFDGQNWTQLSPATSPSARYATAFAYDARRSRIVMFGGAATDETWEFDGSTWIPRTLNPRPSARSFAGMVYDVTRGKLVMFGGTPFVAATWEFDGTTWASSTPASSPSARFGQSMTYDHARRRTVMFGGVVPSGVFPPLDETYLYDGTTWSAPAITVPAARVSSAMTYDVAAGRVVMVGGHTDGGGFSAAGDTWQLVGTRWSPITTSQPPARGAHALTYDRTRRRVVLFGGMLHRASDPFDYILFGDTWELDGTSWSQRVITGPGARFAHAMAFDPVRSSTVLFGGNDATDPTGPTYLADTWELDATGWSPVSTAMAPAGRQGHAMTFDDALGRCVMFGGFVAGGPDPLAWELGTTWTSQPGGPAPRQNAALAYDQQRRRTVMFGGDISRETWERDGATWEQMTPATRPPSLVGPAMAYDIANSRVVAFGGNNSAGIQADTWLYGYTLRTAGEVCQSGVDYDHDSKVGCADDECWTVCTPLCPPGATNCATTLRCGDGLCGGNESCRSCPGDCAVGATCAAVCGDHFCDPSESAATCAGDCP